MNKIIQGVLKDMYNVRSLDSIPMPVIKALDDASRLVRDSGGTLKSTQTIAGIVVSMDTLRTYDPESEFYIGDYKEINCQTD